MLLSTTLRRLGVRRGLPQLRTVTSGPGVPPNMLSTWYNTFGKSSAGYLTWIVAGVIISEGVTGYGTEYVWNYVNHGKTYDSIDWTRFEEKEDEDEDDDDDDDEDEDEEDGDEEEGDEEEDDDDDDE